MLYHLDTNIVIYAVEGQPAFQQRARNHIAALEAAGHRFVVSELSWTECLVWPTRSGNGSLLLDFERFFAGPHLTTAPVQSGVFRRAGLIRATYNYSLPDSMHLAAAVEHRLDRFLTNDNRLAGFRGLPVEILP